MTSQLLLKNGKKFHNHTAEKHNMVSYKNTPYRTVQVQVPNNTEAFASYTVWVKSVIRKVCFLIYEYSPVIHAVITNVGSYQADCLLTTDSCQWLKPVKNYPFVLTSFLPLYAIITKFMVYVTAFY